MRDTFNTDINDVISKHSKLKTNFDDCYLELKHRSDQLRDVQIKTENMTNKFKYNEGSLLAEKQRNIDENISKNNHLTDLKRDNIT